MSGSFGYSPRGAGTLRGLVHAVFGWPNFLRRLQWPTVAFLLGLTPGMRVLDLGAGDMQYAAEIAKRGDLRLLALDLKTAPRERGVARELGFAVVEGKGDRLPFVDASLDRILLSSVLQMVPQPTRLLSECRRVLKPDGAMVLSTPNEYCYIGPLLDSRNPLARGAKRLLGLSADSADLTRRLRAVFRVGGPRGHYRREEVARLLTENGFSVAAHRYVPGRVGSLLWELAVLAHLKIGNLAFHLLFFAYPLARALEPSAGSASGSEHVILAEVARDAR